MSERPAGSDMGLMNATKGLVEDNGSLFLRSMLVRIQSTNYGLTFFHQRN